MHPLKWTVVNETINACTVKTSKNVIVKFLLGLINTYVSRELGCPFHGTYNWTRKLDKDSGKLNYTLTFVKNLKNAPIAELHGLVTGEPEGGKRETLVKLLYFFRAN